MIEVKNLKKAYGDHVVLNHVSETIKKGEKVVIIGPSGSGKSTFLRCLNLMETRTSGEVWFEGKNITDKKVNINEVRQKMGMVVQQFNLFPHLTVKENIMLAPVKLKLMSKEEASEKADKLLERVGLPDKAGAYPKNLSGGQRQRLTIARAIVKKPDVLILDDSASALDFATDAALRKAISGMDNSPTVFIVSQRAASLMHADLIIVLEDGQVAGMGTHEQLLDNCEIYKEIYDSQFKKEGSQGGVA